jgi:predicted metalloprotease with PDZ domain
MKDVQMQWDIEHIRADVSAIRYYVEKADKSRTTIAMATCMGFLLGLAVANLKI